LTFGQNRAKWGLKQPVEPSLHHFSKKGRKTASQTDPDEFCPNIKSEIPDIADI
jgi:hypothetical protein